VHDANARNIAHQHQIAAAQEEMEQRRHYEHVARNTDMNNSGLCMACRCKVNPQAERCRKCQVTLVPLATLEDFNLLLRKNSADRFLYRRTTGVQIEDLAKRIEYLGAKEAELTWRYIGRSLLFVVAWFAQVLLLSPIYVFLFALLVVPGYAGNERVKRTHPGAK